MTQCVESYGCAVGDGEQRDSVAAAGMIGVRHALAVSAWRLKYGNDAGEFRACLATFRRAVRASHHRTLKTAHGAAIALCEPVLRHWIADVCPSCLGRGANPFENTPLLEDAPCSHCGGTGRIAIARIVQRKDIDLASILSGILAEAEFYAGRAFVRKLARNMDL